MTALASIRKSPSNEVIRDIIGIGARKGFWAVKARIDLDQVKISGDEVRCRTSCILLEGELKMQGAMLIPTN